MSSNINRTVVQPLNYHEQRGTLTYTAPDGIEVRTFHAWFMLSLDGRTVVARKVGGRNRWQFCDVADVHEFRVAWDWHTHSRWAK